MANSYVIEPVLPTPFPPEDKFWTCPKTGLDCPLDPAANLAWRARLLQEAERDEGLQRDLLAASRESLLFWVHAFAFARLVQENDDTGKRRQARNPIVPFIPWPIQRDHMTAIETAIDVGEDLLTEKSRDLGSTWQHILVLHHQWLFRDNRLFLEMSRVESDVDGADNPRCLFVKHDIVNQWLPEWMRPPDVLPGQKYRTRMHLVNPLNGSRIDGESSNKAAASGDRRNAILLDEFAKMENGERIRTSTADVTPCRLINSTPWGPGTAYSKWRLSGQVKVFTLPWWESPEKGRGRYVAKDPDTGRYKIRSPWYDAECERRSPKEIAQEIDMDHVGSGDMFFDVAPIEQHKRLFARAPLARRNIDFRKGVANSAIPEILVRRQLNAVRVDAGGGKGKLRLWAALPGGRLDQTRTYIVAADISKGQGASNSVLTIYCKETGEKVGEWADANTPPHDFARIACAVCLWVGGATHGGLPLLIWESNGDPGIAFGREVIHTFRYPRPYFDVVIGTGTDKATKRYGFHSSPEKKAALLSTLRTAYSVGGFINHSQEALDEALVYVTYPDGGIGPAYLFEESSSVRKNHGDRVIADALALWAASNVRPAKPEGPTPPARSAGWRRAAAMKRRKALAEGRVFDFR